MSQEVIRISSLFNHVFIPFVLLMLFSNRLNIGAKNKVQMVVLSFFGILPDADIFLIHRASFHNIFALIIIPLLILAITRNIKVYGIVAFYMMSHVILDTFNGGIFLLYPLSDSVYFSRAEIWFNDGHVIPILSYGIRNSIINFARAEPAISSENIGVIILICILIIMSIILNYRNKVYKEHRLDDGT